MALVFCASLSSAEFCPPTTGPCPGCDEIGGALPSNMYLVKNLVNHTFTIGLYYENITDPVPPPRKDINFTTVIVEVYNESFQDVYRVYTDSQGKAEFDFSGYKDTCVSFKFLYCPFTCESPDPMFSDCGFQECLNFSGIGCSSGTRCTITDIPEIPGKSAPANLKCYRLLPTMKTDSYCPPPKAFSETPEICFPLILIFALLGGAMFISGRNPFSGFDFSTPRVGKHLMYQARSRGFAVDFLASARQLHGGLKMRAAEKARASGKHAQPEGKTPGASGKPTAKVRGARGEELSVGGRAFWQRPKSMAARKAELAASQSQMKALSQQMADSGKFRGVLGYFRGLGYGLATIGTAIVGTSFLGMVASDILVSAVGQKRAEAMMKNLPILSKLSNIFDDATQQKISTFAQLSKDARLANGGFVKKGDKILVRMADGKQAEVVNFDASSVVPNVNEKGQTVFAPTCTLIVEGKQVSMVQGEIVSVTQGNVTYGVQNGKIAEPISINVGGNSIRLESTGGIYKFQSPDGKAYMASLEGGKVVVTDLKTMQQIASPSRELGRQFDAQLTNAIKADALPAIPTFRNEDIVKQIGSQVTHQLQFQTPEIQKMFNGQVTVAKDDITNPNDNTYRVTDKGGNQYLVVAKKDSDGMVQSASIAVAYGKDGQVLDTDASGNYKGTAIKKGTDVGFAVASYNDIKRHYQALSQYASEYQNVVHEELLGKTEIVDNKGNRFDVRGGQIAGGVDSHGNPLERNNYGQFEGTKIKSGQNADTVSGTTTKTPGILEQQRPALYSAVQNLSNPSVAPDTANIYTFTQAVAREDPYLKKSILSEAGALDKSAKAQSKALNDFARNVSSQLSQLPAYERTPENVLGILSAGKGADPATRFYGSMALTSQPDFNNLAGTGYYQGAKKQTSSYNPAQGEDLRNIGLVASSSLVLGLSKTEKGNDPSLAPVYSAAARGDPRATRKELQSALKKLAGEN